MITVLEVITDGEEITIGRRRFYVGSVVYAMLKINKLSYYRTNGREYIKI